MLEGVRRRAVPRLPWVITWAGVLCHREGLLQLAALVVDDGAQGPAGAIREVRDHLEPLGAQLRAGLEYGAL